MVNNVLELQDKAGLLLELAERAAILNDEVSTDFLRRLDNAETRKDGALSQALIARAEAHRTLIKSEIVASLIDEIMTGLTEMAETDHADDDSIEDAHDPEQVSEFLNATLLKYISGIENLPDWRERLRILNTCAVMLALGYTDVNVTGREPRSKA